MVEGSRMTGIRVTQEPLSALAEYGSVSSRFLVRSVLEVRPLHNGLGGWSVTERLLAMPYEKDYDVAGHPTRWAGKFDLSNWVIFAAYEVGGAERLGGAVLAHRTPDVHMLEGRDDLAVLWDIRVQPAVRGRGVGKHLFAALVNAARERQCRWLKIETQNTNVAACRFYASQGCQLRGVHPGVYAEFPDEIQLLWYYDL
jgi:ribosomal protein S18 acetylase RimI-like enzyme